MNLHDVIEQLERLDPKQVLPIGFTNPHSYRGYYERLAFEPETNVTVADCLGAAREANGSTYCGWKGGDFKMDGFSQCHLAFHGRCGPELSKPLLKYLTGQEVELRDFDSWL